MLYGVTATGGSANKGLAFSLTPPASPGGDWTEAILYNFGAGDRKGWEPNALVLSGETGALFGTTYTGYESLRDGILFELKPPAFPGSAWTLNVLHVFRGGDGAHPHAALIKSSGGTLYGTTQHGGAQNIGTVFSLKL